jgi:hypothetical protein
MGMLIGYDDPNTFIAHNNFEGLYSEGDGQIDGSAILFIGSYQNYISGIHVIGNGNGGSGNAILQFYKCGLATITGIYLNGGITKPFFAYKLLESASSIVISINEDDISTREYGSSKYSVTNNTIMFQVFGYL